MTSRANFSRRFGWGSLSLGGTDARTCRTDVHYPAAVAQLSPKPLDLGRNITWSPSLTFSRTDDQNRPLPALLVLQPNGTTDTVAQLASNRVTALNLVTPLRVGSFNWSNTVTMQDTRLSGRTVDSLRQPNLDTPDPGDSITVYRAADGDFQTGLNWDTGINLPLMFRSTWKLQPTLGITNASTQSPFFAVRNRRTGGAWVTQKKRVQFSASLSPTLFFLSGGGLGPISRFRHSFSPLVRWDYAPAADVPEAFAEAVAGRAPHHCFEAMRVIRSRCRLRRAWRERAGPSQAIRLEHPPGSTGC